QSWWRNANRRAHSTKVGGQIFEPHDVIDIGEWVLFAVVQSQIVRDRHSFGNYPAEFFPVPSFGILRGREIIRHHSIPRIPHTGELIQFAKLLVPQGIVILTQRRVFLDFVLWIAQSEALDPVLLLS